MTQARSAPRGFTLLEVIVSLVIVGIAGSALLVLSAESVSAVAKTFDAERHLQEAERVLTIVAGASDDELRRLSGRRIERGHLVAVTRFERGQYRIEVSAPGMPRPLATTVYRRPEVPYAP